MTQLEAGNYPAGRTPKNLGKLCAEKFADSIAVRALPALELYLIEDELYQHDFPSRLKITEYLKQLRRYYTEDTHAFLGSSSSHLRLLVSQSLTDILDFHAEVQEGPRDRQLVALLMFQMLFEDKAGKLPTTRVYGVDHLAQRLEEFLTTFGPFPIKAFYDFALAFHKPDYLAMIVKHMPSLKYVQFNLCYSQCLLESLREHCTLLEEIQIDISACEHVEDKDDTFCKAFFCGLNLQQVLNKLQNQEAVHLTFPKVKRFFFYSTTDRFWPLPQIFIFLLKHLYSDAKINWHYTVTDEGSIESIVKYGIMCPNFVRKGVSLDGLAFSAELVTDDEEFSDFIPHTPMFLKTNYMHFEDFQAEMTNTPFLIGELLKKFSCRKLKLSYASDTSWRLLDNLFHIGPGLEELYLDGPCLIVSDGIQLYNALKQCENLAVLSLNLDLKQNPNWENLGTFGIFPKLKALSLNVEHFPMWEMFPEGDGESRIHFSNLVFQYMKENKMYGNLPAYLNSRDIPARLFLYSFYMLCEKFTLMPQCGSKERYKYTNMESAIFGQGSLTYNVPPFSKLTTFSAVKGKNLEQISDSSASPSCINRIPKFAFYKNSNYDNRFMSNGQTTESKLPLSLKLVSINSNPSDFDVTHYEAGDINATCDNLSSNLKQTILSNQRNQQCENELQQWRPDMMFRAPLSILRALIQSSPNLKILEIPDLRIYDIVFLFWETQFLVNLSNIHTLHLSSQFSTPLLLSVANLKSLKFVSISREYGMDNYLRFKRGLRNTNLDVRLGSSMVYPSSKYLDNL